MRTTRLLALLVPGVLALAACGSSGSSSGAYGASTSTTATSTTATSSLAVSVASNGALGKYLVGGNGHTLYLFEKDQGTTSACTGGCASSWPPLVAEGTPTGGDGIDASALSTANGSAPNQVTYHGHLLYYFAGDQAPGDTNGTSVPSWYPVGPDGNKIDKS